MEPVVAFSKQRESAMIGSGGAGQRVHPMRDLYRITSDDDSPDNTTSSSNRDINNPFGPHTTTENAHSPVRRKLFK